MRNRPVPIEVNFNAQKQERLSRSPKTINIGESEKELEYNIKTLNQRRSPVNMSGSPSQTYQGYVGAKEGNMFLDQPMGSGSFIQGSFNQGVYNQNGYNQGNYNAETEQIGSPLRGNNNINRSVEYPMKPDNFYMQQNSREINYSINPRDIREPMPIAFNKNEPNKNVDDDGVDIKENNQERLKDLKTEMNKKATIVHEGEDTGEGAKQIRTEVEKIGDYVKGKDLGENLTEGEIKKIVRQITRGYDPQKGLDGRLISNTQTLIPIVKDQQYNDRYRVLQKMNKLSSILLSKNRGNFPETTTYRNIDEQKKTFDRNTLKASGNKEGRQDSLSRSPKNKFLFLSLAMLSSRGPNTEDRII